MVVVSLVSAVPDFPSLLKVASVIVNTGQQNGPEPHADTAEAPADCLG